MYKAIELDTQHISSYCLTIEEKTVLGRWFKQNKLGAMDEEVAAKQFELLMRLLPEHGYQHYEISNFAINGFESRHNSSYWEQKPYLGIGPGAHSYDGIDRQYNISNNPLYIKKIHQNIVPSSKDNLSAEQRTNEFILTRIRTSWGVDLIELKSKHNVDLLQFHTKKINLLVNQGLLLIDESRLKLSDKGKLFADKITEELLV